MGPSLPPRWALARPNTEYIVPPSFSTLGVPDHLVARLHELGILDPYPIQPPIPDAFSGLDLFAQSPTGSGKTLAFAIPLVARFGRAQPSPPGPRPRDRRASSLPRSPRRFARSPARRTSVSPPSTAGPAYKAQLDALGAWRGLRRRLPRSSDRPARAGRARSFGCRDRRRRRGGPHGRHGLSPGRAPAPRRGPRRAPDDALLRDAHQGRRAPRPRLPATSEAPRPRAAVGRRSDRRTHEFWRAAREERARLTHRARREPLLLDRLLPHQARRGPTRPPARPGRRAGGGDPRRPFPGPTRPRASSSSGPARRRARRHRRRVARPPRRRRRLRRPLRPARGRRHLCPPLRPDRASRGVGPGRLARLSRPGGRHPQAAGAPRLRTGALSARGGGSSRSPDALPARSSARGRDAPGRESASRQAILCQCLLGRLRFFRSLLGAAKESAREPERPPPRARGRRPQGRLTGRWPELLRWSPPGSLTMAGEDATCTSFATPSVAKPRRGRAPSRGHDEVSARERGRRRLALAARLPGETLLSVHRRAALPVACSFVALPGVRRADWA